MAFQAGLWSSQPAQLRHCSSQQQFSLSSGPVKHSNISNSRFQFRHRPFTLSRAPPSCRRRVAQLPVQSESDEKVSEGTSRLLVNGILLDTQQQQQQQEQQQQIQHCNGSTHHIQIPSSLYESSEEDEEEEEMGTYTQSLLVTSDAEETSLLSLPAHELSHTAGTHPPTTSIPTSSTPASSGSKQDGSQQNPPPQQQQVPQSIVLISMVSMCLTMASCIFNSLMPVYMVTELKMSMQSMGVFEGLLEAFSYCVRMLSGIASDMLVNRKAAITFGFALSACAKFGMSASGTVTQLFLGKAVDKLANGIQAAPRDALIGDLAPAQSRSTCFGFAQSMRKWGSTLGACLTFVLMKVTGNNYKFIFTLAASISLCSCIAFAVCIPTHPNAQHAASSAAAALPTFQQRFETFCKDVKSMGTEFYRMLGVVALYGMGHINESMLEARAVEVGFGKAEATLVIAVLAFVIFLSAYPMGKLDDKYGSRFTLGLGMAALILGDLVLMTSGHYPYAVFAACLLWGVHWAVVQGPMLSTVVALSPPRLRGTAFGIFYSVMALTAVAANTMFGVVWHSMGAVSAFALSATIITGTLLSLNRLLPTVPSEGQSKLAMA